MYETEFTEGWSMVKRIVFSLVILSLAIESAFALPTTVKLYKDKSKFSYENGGEFKAVTDWDPTPFYDAKALSGTGSSLGFQTFCLEYYEYFVTDWSYDVQISDRAIWGGVGPVGDPISKGTAWLYQQFATGNFSSGDYDYTWGAGRVQDAGQLQLAFWILEEETVPASWGEASWHSPATNDYLAMVVSEFGNLTNAKSDYTGTEVAVMNLTITFGCKTFRAQDQLILVPAPAAILLGSIGVGLVGWFRRRRQLQ